MFAFPQFAPRWIVAFGALLAVDMQAGLRADEPIAFERVRPLFQKHCYSCHGAAKAKGKLRIDQLNPDLDKGNDGDHWREVMDRLNFGDMPPAKEPAVKKGDRELMVAWIVQERRRASLAKNQATHFRRLTRREYERTMQDLLGLPIEFGAKLPEDGRSKDGFRNDGDALRMSPLQYETYLQIADDALAEAIVTGPPPAIHRYRLSCGDKLEKYEVVTLPKPLDRPGESFEYQTKKGNAFRIWNMSAPSNKKEPWDGTLPPSAIRRFQEAAVQLPERRLAFGFHPGRRRPTPTFCSSALNLTKRSMPVKSLADSPRARIAAPSPRPNSIGS